MLVFCSLGLATPMRRPRYGLRTTSEHLQSEIWPVFRFALQRYVELSGFSKLFGEKMQKTCILQCRDDKMRCFLWSQVAEVAEVAQNCGRLVRYRVIK